ncbi:S8 family serine peptidase [Streptomyces sp. NPDC020883]|uniref:S8 family serine peptidase n=1 Tax=Streptomyces sp. NPDC020883 TaxID=3365099 RepID=UPI0037B4EC54
MSFTRTLRAVGGAVVAGALLFGTAPVASADQIRNAQWVLGAFKADEVWKIATGKGVTVAVIDDGVQSQHPDLKGNVLPGKSFDDGGSGEPLPGGDTHGTQMASEIAAHGHGPGGESGVKGLAPDAKILPLRLNKMTEDGFAPSIRYAVDHGASVINISIANDTKSPEDEKAIAYALKHNVLIVVASGNDGKGAEGIGYPGSYPGVLTVGGVANTTEIWSGSNYGPPVLLTAPAVDIVSAGDSGTSKYQKGTGTSDSAAYVSAAAALLRQKFPDLTAGQIANRLTKTAGLPPSAKGIPLPDAHYGYGFIRPLRALTSDIPAGPKNGPLKMPQDQASSGGNQANSAGSSGSDPASQPVKKKGWTPAFTAMVAGAGLFVVVVIVLIVVLVRKKSRRNGPPPGGPGGFGGPGGPGGFAPYPPAPPQQPGAPGSYPPPPGR